VEENEHWATLVGVAITVRCPQCKYQVKRLIVLRDDEAEILLKVFADGFVEPVEIKILRGEELIDWVRGRR